MYDSTNYHSDDLEALKITLTDAAGMLSQYVSSVQCFQFASPTESGPEWIGFSFSVPETRGILTAGCGAVMLYEWSGERGMSTMAAIIIVRRLTNILSTLQAVSLLDERFNGVL